MKRTKLGTHIYAAILLMIFTVQITSATSTRFTAKGSGYMGWHSTYTQQFNEFWSGLPEQHTRNQIDWVAKNFKSYGYNYICMDGWIFGATRYNSNGYVTTFTDEWKSDWKEMADYVHSNGLKFGMYYNPGWVHKSVANNTNNKIKGTNYTIQSITHTDKSFDEWYEIDPNLPGAEQYAKGMVEYFISCGIDLLKVDFLVNFENDYDHERAMKLERWIR